METMETGKPESPVPPPAAPKVTAASLLSAIKMIELQVAALKHEAERLMEQQGEPRYTLADLKGAWAGQGDFSEEEIEAALYQLPPGFEDDIATVPREGG
jgi:hypothetical protein